MEEILKKLTELVRICESRVKKLEHENSELAALRVNLNIQKTVQEDREKDIKVQDEALNKKKLIVKTIDEAREMVKESADEKDGRGIHHERVIGDGRLGVGTQIDRQGRKLVHRDLLFHAREEAPNVASQRRIRPQDIQNLVPAFLDVGAGVCHYFALMRFCSSKIFTSAKSVRLISTTSCFWKNRNGLAGILRWGSPK